MFRLVILSCFIAISSGNDLQLWNGRIVGGVKVNITQYPHQLSLQSWGSHFCGASVISSEWSVTAAHCVSRSLWFVKLVSGSTTPQRGGTTHTISQKIIHPDYNPYTIDYDIALLKVSPPFTFSSNVRPITLPSQGEPVTTGAQCDVSGWGTTAEGGKLSQQLQAVTVFAVSEAQCAEAYKYEVISPRMICAGVPEGGKDSCQGDSGGPMVSTGKLVGLSSWGYGCARPGLPGVYTKVSQFRDWIKEKTAV